MPNTVTCQVNDYSQHVSAQLGEQTSSHILVTVPYDVVTLAALDIQEPWLPAITLYWKLFQNLEYTTTDN